MTRQQDTGVFLGLLAGYLSATRQLSPLGLRQARVLSSRLAPSDMHSPRGQEMHALLLLLLHWWERGGAGVGPEQLLEPLSPEALKLQRQGFEEDWNPGWEGLSDNSCILGIFSAMLADPAPWAPLLGRPGEQLPLVVADKDRRLFSFSSAWASVRNLEKNLRDRLRPLSPLCRGDEVSILASLQKALSSHDGPCLHFRQAAACALALRTRFLVISGGPGTGKTSVVIQILRTLMAADPSLEQDRIALCAPTGRAKARIGESVHRKLPEVCALTLHGLLGQRPDGSSRHHRENPLPFRVVVLDEASMADLHIFAALVEALDPQALLLLIGDMHQLPSVDAGAVLGDLTEGFQKSAARGSLLPETDAWLGRVLAAIPHDNPSGGSTTMRLENEFLTRVGPLVDHVVVLEHSYRFAPGIRQLCLHVNAGDADSASACLKDQGDGSRCRLLSFEDGRLALEHLDGCWLKGAESGMGLFQGLRHMESDDRNRHDELDRAFNRMMQTRVLVFTHHGPMGRLALNLRAEQLLRPLLDRQREQGFFHGQQVLLAGNHHDLGLHNGDLGLVIQCSQGLRAVFRQGGAYLSHPVELLAGLESAYAMTVHKAQGSEFGDVLLVLPDRDSPLLTRQILYTGLTRARDSVTLLGAPEMLRRGIERRDLRPGGVRMQDTGTIGCSEHPRAEAP